MCLIWFDMVLFSWRYVFRSFFALHACMTLIIMDLNVICWLDMYDMACGMGVGYSLPMIRTHTIVYLSQRKAVPWDIICWLGDIGHVVIIRVLVKYANRSISWCKSYSDLKYIIFGEGMVWEINFSVGRAIIFLPVIN